MIVEMAPEEAMAAMRRGDVPAQVRVTGDLHFYQQDKLPPPLALPEELEAEDIIIHDASQLASWPRMIRCRQFFLWKLAIAIPADAVIHVVPAERYSWRDISISECSALTTLESMQSESARPVKFQVQQCPLLRTLPTALAFDAIEIDQCPALTALPDDLRSGQITVRQCPSLAHLPRQIAAEELHLTGCPQITALPEALAVSHTLDLTGCTGLTRLPENLDVRMLEISGCTGLRSLPRGLKAQYINMSQCPNIETWDDPDVHILRQLSACGCQRLRTLPPDLWQVDELDLVGCTQLTALPPALRITRWIDVGGTGILRLPPSAWGAQVRWNGVNVTGQIAFHPATITAQQVLHEPNAELRRVLLERMGTARFIAEAQPEVLDHDRDPGGPRQLLRVAVPGDEDLVALQVQDPSTGRHYLLRVPPTMTTCRQAAAWIAGFDDPDAYRPTMET